MDAILFVKTSSLGDVVHNMPAVTDARRLHPDAHIAWVVEEGFAPLARLHPGVDEVIPVATRRWRSHLLAGATWRDIRAFRRILKARVYDRVIDTQGLIRSAILAKTARGERHGYDAASIREPLASRFYDIRHKVSREDHAVNRNRLLTAAALGVAVNSPVDYGLRRDDITVARPYVVLLHGTSRERKEWRESDWIGLGRWLAGQGLDVLISWGTEAEQVRSERLAAAINGSRVLKRRPLDETARVIAGASLVVGVDTGLLHLAAAYSVPLIGIFTATDPGLTGPTGAGPIAILGGRQGNGKMLYPGFQLVIEAAAGLLPPRRRRDDAQA